MVVAVGYRYRGSRPQGREPSLPTWTIGGMTLTVSVPRDTGPWTIDDLAMLSEGRRYEIVDGNLLVSPAPAFRHMRVNEGLREALRRRAPRELHVLAVGGGIDLSAETTSYLV